jgi:energy-coupling factor transport system permease protein
MLHPVAWVGWLGAALCALSATRNPLHLLVILLCIAVVHAAPGHRDGVSFSPVSPLRFALVAIPLAALFNAATAHLGDTALLRLPARWPVVGGAITLEALVFGTLNGLVLAGIFAAFAVLNRALPIRALIRLIPRAFFPVAVVIAIAVTFVPTTLRQFQQIREAQAVRGHRVRGLRDWLPLFMPLLVGGLERALGLAEAMTARGFASAGEATHDARTRTAVLLGLVALLGGWLLRLAWGQALPGLGLLLTGVGLIASALWVVGRRVPRTTYRPEPWTWRDWAVLLSAAVVPGALVLPGLNRAALFYSPYPALSLPGFDPLVGLATLGLLGPAFLLARGGERERS